MNEIKYGNKLFLVSCVSYWLVITVKCRAELCMQTVVLDASNSDEKMRTKVFHCLGSWLILDVIPQQHLMASKLLSSVFSALVNYFIPCRNSASYWAFFCTTLPRLYLFTCLFLFEIHAIRMQSLKFMPFEEPEKLRWQKQKDRRTDTVLLPSQMINNNNNNNYISTAPK